MYPVIEMNYMYFLLYVQYQSLGFFLHTQYVNITLCVRDKDIIKGGWPFTCIYATSYSPSDIFSTFESQEKSFFIISI
jgi:hypothetical protein